MYLSLHVVQEAIVPTECCTQCSRCNRNIAQVKPKNVDFCCESTYFKYQCIQKNSYVILKKASLVVVQTSQCTTRASVIFGVDYGSG